jgi:tetratricopeptide (TPR) repeat protein
VGALVVGLVSGGRRSAAPIRLTPIADSEAFLPAEVIRSEPADPASLQPDLWSRNRRSRRHRVAAEAHFRRAWDRALTALPEPVPGPTDRSFRRFPAREAWELLVEERVAAQDRVEVARGLAEARRAVATASTAAEEYAARESLGRGLILSGEYDTAIDTLRPLLPLLYPPRPSLLLRRAYRHRGLSVEDPSLHLWIGDPFAFNEPEACQPRWLAQSLAANLALGRRWPRDPVLRLRVGWQYLDLAQVRAAGEPGFPQPGPAFGRRVSRYVVARYPALIDQGIAHCRRAAQLSTDRPALRARALEGLGHGYLMRRRFDQATAYLKQSVNLVPTLAQARDDLRQAARRQHDPPAATGSQPEAQQAAAP